MDPDYNLVPRGWPSPISQEFIPFTIHSQGSHNGPFGMEHSMVPLRWLGRARARVFDRALTAIGYGDRCRAVARGGWQGGCMRSRALAFVRPTGLPNKPD